MRRYVLTEDQLRRMGVLAFEGSHAEVRIGINYEPIGLFDELSEMPRRLPPEPIRWHPMGEEEYGHRC